MKKQNIIIALVIAVLAITIGYGIYKAVIEARIPQPTLTLDKITDNYDWYKGNKDAKNIMVEYSDFQCPACRSYAPIVKQLSEEMGQDLVIVYRHFPLSQHKQADLAARAAEAAGNQGKFWEMNDKIFASQLDWADKSDAMDKFTAYAQELGLDIEKFKSDIVSSEVKAKVKNQYKSGIEAKVSSTPSFFINGQKIQNPKTYEEFKTIIQTLTGQPVQPAA